MRPMIAIIDYRAGNLTSVRLACESLGLEALITSDPATIQSAERVIFPGVGAAGAAMGHRRWVVIVLIRLLRGLSGRVSISS